MYSILDITEEILYKSIEKINIFDRNKYVFFLNIIESYIIDNNLIIGGNFANNLINYDDKSGGVKFNPTKNIHQSTYEIYSEEPREDAIKLVSILFEQDKNGIGRYSYAFPYIPNNIYQIYVNNRLICILKKLPMYKGIQIEKLITCQNMPSLYGERSFLCMGNYIQLINLYGNINNPNDASNWEKLILLEKKIRKLYLSTLFADHKKVNHKTLVTDLQDTHIQGHPQGIKFVHTNQKTLFDNTELPQNELYKKIELHQNKLYKKFELHQSIKLNQNITNKYDISFIYTYLNNSNRIIIGDIGIYMLNNRNKTINYNNIKNYRIQLLTTNNLENEGKLLSSIGQKYKIDIQWSISLPKYIDDFRLKRLTAYIMIDGKKQTLLDMFNYGEYNLIGYNTIKVSGIDKNHPKENHPKEKNSKENHLEEKNFKENHSEEKTLKYGSVYILMKFRLIDEWIFNLLYELKSIPESYAKDMIKHVRNGYLEASNFVDHYLSDDAKIILYISELEYIGIYKDINIELKRKKSQLNNYYSIYYPLTPTKYKLV
jgi:hypothetical protein